MRLVGTCRDCGHGWDYQITLPQHGMSGEQRQMCRCGRNRIRFKVRRDVEGEHPIFEEFEGPHPDITIEADITPPDS